MGSAVHIGSNTRSCFTRCTSRTGKSLPFSSCSSAERDLDVSKRAALSSHLCTPPQKIRSEGKRKRAEEIGKEKVILLRLGPWGIRTCFATTRLTDAILSWTCCPPYPKGNHGGIKIHKHSKYLIQIPIIH
jgi:hypothetical protein